MSINFNPESSIFNSISPAVALGVAVATVALTAIVLKRVCKNLGATEQQAQKMQEKQVETKATPEVKKEETKHPAAAPQLNPLDQVRLRQTAGPRIVENPTRAIHSFDSGKTEAELNKMSELSLGIAGFDRAQLKSVASPIKG